MATAIDLWTAFRENALPNQSVPWLGCLKLVEKSDKSVKPVIIYMPHFKVFPRFKESSYRGILPEINERKTLSPNFLIRSKDDKSYENVNDEFF